MDLPSSSFCSSVVMLPLSNNASYKWLVFSTLQPCWDTILNASWKQICTAHQTDMKPKFIKIPLAYLQTLWHALLTNGLEKLENLPKYQTEINLEETHQTSHLRPADHTPFTSAKDGPWIAQTYFTVALYRKLLFPFRAFANQEIIPPATSKHFKT